MSVLSEGDPAMSGGSLNDAFERLVDRFDPGARLVRAWDLSGGVSAQVTALQVERRDGMTRRVVVRRHGERDLRQNPNVAADEFRLLRALAAAGLPVPAPVFVDETGGVFGTPCLVVGFVDGAPDFAPDDLDAFVDTVAELLIRIHRVDPATLGLPHLPDKATLVGDRIDELQANEAADAIDASIYRALASAWPPDQVNRTVLLHGDYWPGNLLWQKGRLSAVIDWEDAAIGDPLSDLANCRRELLWAFGDVVMERFTRQYVSLTGIDVRNLPQWDLAGALGADTAMSGWGLDEQAERAMREGLARFVGRAIDALR
jgi:aminoglycoside phosphotransferase (APT) family kinase protein